MKKLLLEQRTINVQRRFPVGPEDVSMAHRVDGHSPQQSRLHQLNPARRAPASPLLVFVRERVELPAILFDLQKL
jgi:hypothetical protein